MANNGLGRLPDDTGLSSLRDPAPTGLAHSASIPSAGQLYTVSYPFVKDTYAGFDEEGGFEASTWRPGIRFEWISPEDTAPVADGQGLMQLIVVDTFKPGRFPTRVFYTRSWTDPDGNTFGKGCLHITTLGRFRRISRGYQHPYGIGAPLPDAQHHLSDARAFFEAELASAIEARQGHDPQGHGAEHESATNEVGDAQ
jgi:hypothetical protein